MTAARMITPRISALLRDPYYTNSGWMVLASLTSAGAGFLFWVLVAKLYPSNDVGVASAVISSGLLIVAVSRLGLEQAVIRFFPERDQGAVYSSALAVILTVSAVVTLSFYLLAGALAPALTFTPGSFAVFLVLIVASSLLSLTGVVFVAKKRAVLLFLQSVIHASRILFLPVLIAFGSLGIIGSMGAATVVASLFSMAIISTLGIRLSRIDRSFLRLSVGFSASNYAAGLLMTTPGLLLPVITLGILGSSAAAYYYMAYSIASILFLVPSALGTTLFVEGSHGADLARTTAKTLRSSVMALVPLIALTVLLGHFLLSYIGPEYSQNGFTLLVLISVSSLPFALIQAAYSVLLVRKSLGGMVLLGLAEFSFVLAATGVLIGPMGLDGVGLGWLLGNSAVATVSAIWVLRPMRSEGDNFPA